MTYHVLRCFDVQSFACECTSPLLGFEMCCTKGRELSHSEQFLCVCWLDRIASPGQPQDSNSNMKHHVFGLLDDVFALILAMNAVLQTIFKVLPSDQVASRFVNWFFVFAVVSVLSDFFSGVVFTPHASLGLPLKNAVIPTSHKSKTGFEVENHFLKLQKCHKMSIHYGPVVLARTSKNFKWSTGFRNLGGKSLECKVPL